MIPVRYSSSLERTCFAENFLTEKREAALDNLNLLYVAFTRATDVLIAFCPYGATQKTVGDAVFSSLEIQPGQEIYRVGDPDFKNPDSALSPEQIGIAVTGYSVFRHKAEITPTEEEDFTIVRYGRMIHRILESVNHIDDIEAAVSGLLAVGEILPGDLSKVRKSLNPILEMPEISNWFGGTWEVRNEPVILVPDSGERRPDRVMIRGNETVVLDYKTGLAEPSHRRQLEGYRKTLERMGYANVRGFLLYLDPPELVEIKSQEDFFLPFPMDPEA
jgi:ATP-dependent exoDNAse (exonuclease V) beta subunit